MKASSHHFVLHLFRPSVIHNLLCKFHLTRIWILNIRGNKTCREGLRAAGSPRNINSSQLPSTLTIYFKKHVTRWTVSINSTRLSNENNIFWQLKQCRFIGWSRTPSVSERSIHIIIIGWRIQSDWPIKSSFISITRKLKESGSPMWKNQLKEVAIEHWDFQNCEH